MFIAKLMDVLVKKDSMQNTYLETNEAPKQLKVDMSYCMGCGVCTSMAPDIFTMEKRRALVVKSVLEEHEMEIVERAAAKCPAKAIKYSTE